MESSKDGPVGLGGWLILPALGLLFLPVRLLMSFYQDYLPIFKEGYWETLTTPGTEAYHHLWAPYIIFEISINSIFLIFDLILLFLFFSKSHKLPILIIVFYVSSFIFVLADFFIGDMIPFIASEPNDPEVIKEVARSVIGILIWVPYFLVSKRVKNTFVKKETIEDKTEF